MRKILFPLLSLFLTPLFACEVQAGEGGIFAFGDSFLDYNYYCNGWNTPLGACSNYRNTLLQLAAISSYSSTSSDNFAIGATASGSGSITVSTTSHPAYPGHAPGDYPELQDQVSEFLSLGRTIGQSDLVLLSYAGNDIRYGSVASGLAQTVAGNISTAIAGLIERGGRNFILFGAMPFDEIIVNGSSIANAYGVSNADDKTYYTALNPLLAQTLAGYESENVHIRILDINTLAKRILSTPETYGFKAGDCATVFGYANCLAQPLATQNEYAFFNGHPSDSFSLVIAKYIANLLNSAYQVPFQANLAQDTAQAFSSGMMSRLMSRHTRSQKPEAEKPGLSFFGSAGYAGGNIGNASSNYDANWGRAAESGGAEYLLKNGLLLGLRLGFTDPAPALGNDLGGIALHSYQLGAYASIERQNWFADIAFSGALNRYQLRRPGVIDTLTAAPNGDSFSSSAQGGYLMDLAGLRCGPLAGIRFIRVSVASYDESGDLLLAQHISSQRMDTLSGWAGGQLLVPPFKFGRRTISAFLNLTAEHDLLPGDRTITSTGLDHASALPVYTPATRGITTYGKIAGGIMAGLSDSVSLDLTSDATFSREYGNNHSINATVLFSF